MTDARSFDQRLFGLHVRSTLPIPFALPAGEGPPDVVATFGSMPEWLLHMPVDFRPLDRDRAPYILGLAGDAYVFDYDDGTRILLTHAEIWMTWRDPLNFEDACTYLVGAAFALLLRLRHHACLHASAVLVDGRAIAIVGPSGAGKSTIAAVLVRSGATLIAEDVLPLSMHDRRVFAVPAYAGIRLWPEAVELLLHSRDALPKISPTWDKRVLEVSASQFAEIPHELSSIVLLTDHEETLRASDAVMRLVSNSYRAELLDPAMRRREFAIFSELAATRPIRAIRAGRDRDPEVLASLCTTSSITA